MSLGVSPDPATSFHMGSARLRLSGEPVRMAMPMRRPRKRYMLRCASEVRAGFRIRQSLFSHADSSRIIRLNGQRVAKFVFRGLPYMTSPMSTGYWDFLTPSPSSSAKSVLFIRQICVLFVHCADVIHESPLMISGFRKGLS